MTEARGRAIDPGADSGLAFSTTEVYGDCRASPPPTTAHPAVACASTATTAPVCVRARSALRVLVAPVNESLALGADCSGGYDVPALAALAVADAHASEAGEVVLRVAPGRYTVGLTRDDRCASCGVEGGGQGCLVDVVSGHLTARDLVLDRSTH
jgi:hypothetical protein